ncbi:hypothetical protein K2X85_12295 [bacterium]|nr:hypothetical protein [bacterium]
MKRTTVVLMLMSLLMTSSSLRAEGIDKHHQLQHHYRQYQGEYYPPGPYYSRAYIQQFPLDPGDRILLYRLRPFQHYGRYEYGCPIEPGLTRGTVESFRFPYRYQWGFRPTADPKPIEDTNCEHPLARRYRSLVPAEPTRHGSNEPVEVPAEE